MRRLGPPPERVFRHLPVRGPFETRVAGAPLRLVSHGDDDENRVFWLGLDRAWEPAAMAAWTRLARRASAVVDAGAELGYFVLAAGAVRPDASLLALEPLPALHTRLAENVAASGLDVTCVRAAAGDRSGRTALPTAPDGSGGRSRGGGGTAAGPEARGRGPASARPVLVRTVRLDALVAGVGSPLPDLVKIDAAGREAEVLEGLGSLLERRPSLLTAGSGPASTRAVAARAEALGYDRYAVVEGRGLVPAGSRDEGHGGRWLLVTPERAEEAGLDALVADP